MRWRRCAGRSSSTRAWGRCRRWSARLFATRIAQLPDPHTLKDAKTRLQEYLQSRSLALPGYAVLAVNGEDHAQTFRVSCEVPGLELPPGEGSSRRRAEQEAAERMLAAIHEAEGTGPT